MLIAKEVLILAKIEVRKVQITGGSSFIITLPKEWAQSLDLKKGDPLNLITQPDGNLVISSGTFEKSSQKSKEFDIDKIDDPMLLFRLLIGAYIMGYSSFEIKSKKKIGANYREWITNFAKSTIGPEIIEEKMTFVKIKDLLNPSEMPLFNTIERMSVISSSMHEEAIKSIVTKDKSLIDEIINRDSEVDRLKWMIARQSNMVINDVMLSKQMKISQNDGIYYSLLSKYIERIADHAVRIAKYATPIIESTVNDKILESISKASKIALTLFEACIDAWMKKNIVNANENIERIPELLKACDEINTIATEIKGEVSIAISYVADSIRRTGEYSIDISELTINHLVIK